MERKKGAREAPPAKKQTTGTSHAERTPDPPRTEEARPSIVPSTSSVQTPATGTPQTPSIPLDLVEKLLASISPGFNLTHTLTRLAAENTNPILVQPTTMPTPQWTIVLPELSVKPVETPHEKLPEPSTKLTETLPEKEVEPEPETPTSPTPEQKIVSQTPTKITAKIPTVTPTKAPVDNPVTTREDPTTGSVGERGRVEEGVRDEEMVEAVSEKGVEEGVMEEKAVEVEVGVETEEIRVERERDFKTKAVEETAVAGLAEDVVEDESDGEESAPEMEKAGDSTKKKDSEGTKVLSEEKTEVVGSGDEMNMGKKSSQEKEVDQEIEGEERDIILLEDDDIAAEDKHEEGADQRTIRRKTRLARRIAEILATGKDRQMGGEPSEAEEEEEEEIRLIRRPRSTRVTVTEETPIPATKEDDPTPVDEAEDVEEEPVDEGKYKRGRKRKGKLPERPVKKRSKQAARNVVIQEPIQVPYKQAEEKSDEKMEEETEDTASERREDPQPTHYRKIFVKVDRYLLQRMEKFKDPKLQEECKKRVTEGKKVKSGKKIHLPSLQDLAAEEKLMAYIKGIGFEWLLVHHMPEVPVVLAKEFFTSFRFKATTDLDEVSISFRVYDREMDEPHRVVS